MQVRIVAVPDLAVLDLGEGALGYVDRVSRAWVRVADDQVVAGGIWEAIEDVNAGWHAAGEPERAEIGRSVDREGRGRVWLRRPDGWCADTDRAPANRPSPSPASRPDAVVEVDGPAAEPSLVHRLQPRRAWSGMERVPPLTMTGTRSMWHSSTRPARIAWAASSGPPTLRSRSAAALIRRTASGSEPRLRPFRSQLPNK
jgi:hypothetical protein